MTTSIGIIGCGNVSTAYLRTLTRAPDVRVVALADLDPERARARADEFGIANALTPDALLASDAIDLVIDLTIPSAHYDVNRRALEAGKHVYSEKPLAASATEAHALRTLAQARGLALGGAPDTFLGVGLQTARAAIDAGVIGRPFAAAAHMCTGGPERWHHDPAFFYQGGAGPLLDMGPYYVTTMVVLFGAVASVTGEGLRPQTERTVASGPLAGARFPVAVDTHVTLTLRFVSGLVATLLTTFDVPATDLPRFEVYGEGGTLSLPDPNTFKGPVRRRGPADDAWHEVVGEPGISHNARGIGALDLLVAHRQGRPARASAALAAHVLEVLEAGLTSVRAGHRVAIDSRPERPDPLTVEDLHALGWTPEVVA